MEKGGERMKEIKVPIEGMSCAACVLHVEKAAKALLGV
jgi:copper chaperone CopZ